MACAWHRQVRRADAPPRQAHATKRIKTENQTERRGGAEPSPLNRSGDGCRFFRRAILSLHWFCRYGYLLNFASFGRLRLA